MAPRLTSGREVPGGRAPEARALPERRSAGPGAVLALQSRIGSRSVALLLRQAATQNVSQGQPGSPMWLDLETEARKDLPEHEPPDPKEEWELTVPMAKLATEYLEGALEHHHLPGASLFGYFAKAWGVLELYELWKTHDAEHLGSAVTSGAVLLEKAAERRLEAGGVEATGRWVVAKWGSRVVALAWTGWEFFKIGATVRAELDAQDWANKMAANRWRYAMTHHVWLDYLAELDEEREHAFDEMMGGRRGYAQRIALKPSAAKQIPEIINEASDDWRVQLPRWQRAASSADPSSYRASYWYWHEELKAEDISAARDEMAAVADRLAGHFARLRDFMLDPANWALTAEQQKMLDTLSEDDRRSRTEHQIQASLPDE